MSLTSDPNDPRLTRGPDEVPRPQAAAYLVLSEEERARGFVRPVRYSYVHAGPPGPAHVLRDLTPEQREHHEGSGYIKYESYENCTDHDHRSALGRYWTKQDLDYIGRGCGTETRMNPALAETYARDPHFYGATYCVGCHMHLPVNQFRWAGTDEVVGS